MGWIEIVKIMNGYENFGPNIFLIWHVKEPEDTI